MRELTTAMLTKYDSKNWNDYKHIHCSTFGTKTDSETLDLPKLRVPQLLTLDSERISTIGDISVVDETLHCVKELDLSKNFITSWKEVLTLLDHMPHLELLNLTKNFLDDSTLEGLDEELTKKYRVKTLVLNGTKIGWPALAKIMPCFPCLEELHISLNGYKTVDVPPDFKHEKALRTVFMNNSKIDSWEELIKVGRAFPRIQTFNIIGTNVSTINDAAIRHDFPILMVLNISQSNIESWEEIEKFANFRVLVNLRITEVPFLDQFDESDRRKHLISRIPALEMLNGSPVSEMERINAERWFIRHYMDEEIKPSIFNSLIERHGKLSKLADVDLSLTDSETDCDMINLLVKFDDKMEYFDIDKNLTTADFKKLLEVFTGLPPSEFIVYYIEKYEDIVSHVHHLRTAGRRLYTYRIKKNDQFVIEKKPPPSK